MHKDILIKYRFFKSKLVLKYLTYSYFSLRAFKQVDGGIINTVNLYCIPLRRANVLNSSFSIFFLHLHLTQIIHNNSNDCVHSLHFSFNFVVNELDVHSTWDSKSRMSQLTLPHTSMWAELKQRGTEGWKLNAGPEKHPFPPYKEGLHSQHLELMLNSSML